MTRVALVLVVIAGCGDNLAATFDGLVRVSGDSPFSTACVGSQPGEVRRGVEVEPSLAIDPTDPRHMTAVWQQDRWTDGGSSANVTATSFDGGVTWTRSTPPFSQCAGGAFQRATDPWVTYGPDGTAFQIAVAFDKATTRNAVLATSSADGVTWSEPVTLRFDDGGDVFNDKESITADPTAAGVVYAVWDRLTGLTTPNEPIGTGPTWFARRSPDGWQESRVIYDPGVDSQTIGNIVAVLPDGTLVTMFNRITAGSTLARSEIVVIRSTDQGDTWSAPIVVSPLGAVGILDPANDRFVRGGEDLPAIAVDPTSGILYITWASNAFSGGASDDIALATSLDGGVTWSAPIRVNQAPTPGAFEPEIAVMPDGTLGVTYYDLRDQDRSDRDTFRVATWLATSHDRGATWTEEPLTGLFDLRSVLIGDYFLGDYQGLAATASAFVPLFAAATSSGSDVFVRPSPP